MNSVFLREIRIALRNWVDLSQPILFFGLVVIIFPLGVSSDSTLLHTIAPGIIWTAALLASLLCLPRLFDQDFQSGCLEQMLLQPGLLSLSVLAKVTVHWLSTGFPLIVLSPLLCLLLHLNFNESMTLFIGLLLGTPVLSLLGGIISALTLGLNQGGLLLALLLLPLYIPILIFGAGSVVLVGQGMNATGLLLILAALLVFTLSVTPLATAAALRIGVANN